MIHDSVEHDPSEKQRPTGLDHAHTTHSSRSAHRTHAEHAGRTEHPAHEHPGHDHAGHAAHVAQYRRLFFGMLVLGIPVVLLSGMFADIMGYQPPDLPLRGRRCGPSRRPRASRRRDRQRNGRSGVWPEDQGSAVADLQRQVIKSPWLATGSTAPGAGPGGRRHRIGAGTNVAVIIAGVVLAGSDPRSVLSVIELSRQSHRKMKQNLAWAAGYDLGHRCHWPPEFWARSDSCCR